MEHTPLFLKYRPSVFRFYRWVISLTLFAELLIVRANIFRIMEEGWLQGSVTLILASTVPISILIRVFFFVRPWVKSEYELHSDKLIIRSGKKERELKFAEVARVNYSWLSPRFFGGFNLELASGQKFRFFSVLENSHKILERLHEIRSDILVEEEYQSYMQVSQSVDLSWARLVRKLSNWKVLILKYIVTPSLCAWFLWYNGWSIAEKNNYVSILGILVFVFWVLAGLLNHFEEVYLIKKPEADLKMDIIIDVVYFILAILVTAGVASSVVQQ